MGSHKLLMTVLLTSISLESHAKFEAHEWGTFTSLVGSSGVTQSGMYHEDEVLPSFVHPFGELRAESNPKPPVIPDLPERPCHFKMCPRDGFFQNQVVTQKMETPVIYFYADQETKVDVNVKFPKGVVTETYPGPVKTFPTKDSLQVIENGDTTFSVNVLNRKGNEGPYVDSSNIYAHARNVASNLVQSGIEREKFIFYRGIGQFQPKLSITSQKDSVLLKIPKNYSSSAAFLVHVDAEQRMKMYKMGSLNSDTQVILSQQFIQDLKNPSNENRKFISGEEAKGALVDALVASGLNKDEAVAMINTWENGYLKVAGLRMLYILPRSEADEVLPLTFNPAPEKLVRTFVARIEILTESEEERIIHQIMAPNSNFQYFHLGRFAEPMLRRVREVYQAKFPQDLERLQMLNQLVERAQKDEVGHTGTVH